MVYRSSAVIAASTAHSHACGLGGSPDPDVAGASSGAGQPELLFGPFRLLLGKRLLMAGHTPVRLGERAFDLLLALVGQPAVVLGKQELIATVWPGVFVDEGNLKVQIAALRRALRNGRDGNRYIAAVPGRGYCFVMPVARSAEPSAATAHPPAPKPLGNLPAPLAPLFGRDAVIERITRQLSQQRLLTLVGAGGIGKTSVAVAAARDLCAAFDHGAWFADLTAIDDQRRLPAALASMIGLTASADELLPALLSFLGDKRMLLVLDNCEHLVEGAAHFALAALQAAPGLRILATSREPLSVDCERVCRLSPLEYPPRSPSLDAAQALAFPAVRLFVECAANALGEFKLRDADAPSVCEICRKLDGNPLAIDGAAAAVATFGVPGLASRLNDPLQMPHAVRRTLAPRHRSLRGAFDWGYRLLAEDEQRLLRRLAVFADTFTMADVAEGVDRDGAIADLMAGLVAKSLVEAIRERPEPRFGLSAVTRAYALEKLIESGEAERPGRSGAIFAPVIETAGSASHSNLRRAA